MLSQFARLIRRSFSFLQLLVLKAYANRIDIGLCIILAGLFIARIAGWLGARTTRLPS